MKKDRSSTPVPTAVRARPSAAASQRACQSSSSGSHTQSAGWRGFASPASWWRRRRRHRLDYGEPVVVAVVVVVVAFFVSEGLAADLARGEARTPGQWERVPERHFPFGRKKARTWRP